ncbi:hypothetical protein BDN70DRAFT_836226 [Pholiota conissans]|uniref:Acyltransferase MbtK/IucB-like conserved domain-containing protein n=1 Tax=Pholiota conissans TaxID=109636 RepID=A0A9P5YZ08_9AGAR|nr:hypothetical protein BDN70DRAFT_836226 [Pholiota conissans]
MEASTTPARRLQSVANHTASATSSTGELLLVLPDGGKVQVSQLEPSEQNNDIFLDGAHILTYTISNKPKPAFDVASVGTPFQGNTKHIPKYSPLTLTAPSDVALADFWVNVYALFTLYHTQENIPITLDALPNNAEIRQYLLASGLARLYPTPHILAAQIDVAPTDILFLSRATFWQGAGTVGFHTRPCWLLNPKPIFPWISSYTRSERVIAMHPLRPEKPQPGEVLYRRYCSAVGQTLDITYFDLDGVHDGSAARSKDGVSRHLTAFHKWHNDDRVNAAWGERGDLATHRAYVEGVMKDPHALLCMLSWDGELMGYVEIVYTKEDHVAQHYPSSVVPGLWERGIHVLVGESKFLGGGRSEIWLRCLIHYIFLDDPRTARVIGEPSSDNLAITKAALAAGFHSEITFDFPYKRSNLLHNPREKFFTLCKLR